MSQWIDMIVEWVKGLNIYLQIGLGTLLFVGIVTFLFKKPWGSWFYRQKYKKFDDMGHEIDHPDEYYRNYYGKKE